MLDAGDPQAGLLGNLPHNGHSSYVGLVGGRVTHHPLERMNDELDRDNRRPLNQWWLGLREAIPLVSQNVGVLALEDVPDFRATVEEAASL